MWYADLDSPSRGVRQKWHGACGLDSRLRGNDRGEARE